MRQVPRLVIRSLRLIWDASPRDFIVVATMQVLSGIVTATLLLVVRNTLTVIMNTAQVRSSPALVLPALALLVVVNLGTTFISGIQAQQQQVISELVSQLTTDRILRASGGADLAAFDSPSFYDRLQRASVGATFRPWQMTQAVLGSVHSIITVSALLAALYLLAPLLIPMMLPVFVPLWLASTFSGRSMYRFLFDVATLDRRRAYIRRLLIERENAKEVRVYGLAAYLRQLNARLSEDRIASLRNVVRSRTLAILGGSASTSLLVALMLGILVYLVANGWLNLPSASAAALAVFQLGGAISGLVSSASQISENALYIEDYLTFLDADPILVEPEALRPQRDGFDVLRVSHVHFRYHGSDAEALNDVSLEIRRGQVVALVGENGSGKTTLAKLLCGLYRPDEGRILWDGVDASATGAPFVRNSTSIVFQDFVRYMFTVGDNIGMGRVESMADRAAIAGAASKAGADRFIDVLPTGYDTQLGRLFEGGEELSEGQWQRIALARAFFRDAPFVILDEPTADLDARAEHALFAAMKSLFKGRTVLLISHRLSGVRSADQIFVLDRGRVVEHGTHDQLIRNNGLYEELFRLQESGFGGATALRAQ